MSHVSEPFEIRSRRQWRQQLTAARGKVEALGDALPWTVSSVVAGRLDQLAHVDSESHVPSRLDRERGLGLGVVAVRGVWATDPELCQLLLALSDAYDRWAALPES